MLLKGVTALNGGKGGFVDVGRVVFCCHDFKLSRYLVNNLWLSGCEDVGRAGGGQAVRVSGQQF